MIWIFRMLLASLVVFWCSALMRALRSKADDRYRAEPDSAGPDRATTIGVVIPARNEERNIGSCVDSVLAQDADGIHVVALNDGSTDSTALVLSERSADPKLTVVDGGVEPLPEGWLGKAWACQRGAQHLLARTDPPEWLLFVDADVALHPRAVSAAVGHAQRNDVAMVSGLGRLVMKSFWEKVMQPVMAGLIMAGNDLERVNDPDHHDDRPLANGQFILVRRDAYEAVGGHSAVRTDVLDDVGMASAVTGAGFPYHLIFMRDLFTCRMYTSLAEIWEGWTKNMYAGMRYSTRNLMLVMTFVAWTSLFPYGLLLYGLAVDNTEWIAWGGGISCLIQAVRLWLDIQVGQDPRYGPTQPLGVLLLVALLAHSGIRAKRGTAAWKGRAVPIVKYASQASEDGADST